MLGAPRILDPKELDAFLAINADGTVTVFCGKVDLGQGLRIAMRQIVAEELDVGVDKINYIEGDTALTPDQGRTSGSNGIQRGGMQMRRAAATARKALVALAAQKLNAKPDDLVVANGLVSPRAGGEGVTFASLVSGKRFDLKVDAKRAAQGSGELHAGRQVAAAARRAGEMHGQSRLHAGLLRAGHAACARDPAAGDRRQARIRSTNRRSRIFPA